MYDLRETIKFGTSDKIFSYPNELLKGPFTQVPDLIAIHTRVADPDCRKIGSNWKKVAFSVSEKLQAAT